MLKKGILLAFSILLASAADNQQAQSFNPTILGTPREQCPNCPYLDPVPVIDLTFEQFKARFSKVYESQEVEVFRRRVFEAKRNYMNKHNANSDRTFDMRINQFSDLTFDEFVSKNTGFIQNQKTVTPARLLQQGDPAQLSIKGSLGQDLVIDWSCYSKTEIVSQFDCGCCYIVAPAQTIEMKRHILNGQVYQEFIDGRQLLDEKILSIQQHIDCSSTGCVGGDFEDIYKQAKYDGIEVRNSYGKEVFKKQQCKSGGPDKVRLKIWDYRVLSQETCHDVLCALKSGPLTAAIIVFQEAQDYGGGVLTKQTGQSSGLIFSSTDTSLKLNHAVTVVGYDRENLFRIKNSWGTTWGERGYGSVAPDPTQICRYVIYPQLRVKEQCSIIDCVELKKNPDINEKGGVKICEDPIFKEIAKDLARARTPAP